MIDVFLRLFGVRAAPAVALTQTGERDAGTPRTLDDVVSMFEQMRVPLFRYLLSSRVPVADAEEIIQDAFLLLFQNLSQGKVTRNPQGWLFRTAHHLMLRHRDRSRRQAQYFENSQPDPEAVADLAAPPDVALEESRRQQCALAVVRALPEQDQSCIYLRAEGLRYREIAEVLGMSLGAVANSLQRSIARITRAGGL